MNVIVLRTPCLPTLASFTSLSRTYVFHQSRKHPLSSTSEAQQQQIETNSNTTADNVPAPPLHSAQAIKDKERSKQTGSSKSKIDVDPVEVPNSPKISLKTTDKPKRLSRKEKASRKAVRRLRLLESRAAESKNEGVQERSLISASKVLRKLMSLNENSKDQFSSKSISYTDQPSSDDKDEWRKAMLRLSSIFRRDGTNESSWGYRSSATKERFKFNNTESSYSPEIANTTTQPEEDNLLSNGLGKITYRNRLTRASINSQTIDQARQSQPETTSNEKVTVESNIAPGSGIGPYPRSLLFEKTAMQYPPADRYPPPIPLVRELNIELAATAFSLNRVCDVHWVQGKGNDDSNGKGTEGSWRKIMHGAEYFAQNMDSDRMDNGQGLEYIGDSVLHLISRSCIMAKFPRRSMMLYNLAANWLVSNDVFGHIFIDAGLEDERKFIADILLHQSKQRQLDQMRSVLTAEQFQLRQDAPLPAQQLPVLQHLRQADLFEAYVGAIYLTYGFQKASTWCSALFEPWIDRIARTENFLSPSSLTQAGEVRARIEEQIREEVRREFEQRQQRAKGNLFNYAGNWLRSVFGDKKRKST